MEDGLGGSVSRALRKCKRRREIEQASSPLLLVPCFCPGFMVLLLFQNPSNFPRGEEPPGLSGAAQGEVGGECL